MKFQITRWFDWPVCLFVFCSLLFIFLINICSSKEIENMYTVPYAMQVFSLGYFLVGVSDVDKKIFLVNNLCCLFFPR